MDIQPNAQGKKFNLTPLSPKDFELAPVTAEAFMPENLGGITPEQPGIEAPDRTLLQDFGAGIKKGWLQAKSGIGGLVSEVAPASITGSVLNPVFNPVSVMGWADDVKAKAIENKKQAEAIKGKGIVFEAGTFVPQMAGTVGALLAAPFTGGTSMAAVPALIGGANLGFLTSQVVGNSLLDIEEYAQANNKEISDLTKWSVALLSGAAEFAAEKIRLDRILPKGMTSKMLTTLLKEKPGVAEDLMKGWAKKNPSLYKKFIEVVKTTGKQGFEEGTEEFFTQIAQDYANYLYQNPDDRLDLKQILSNSVDAFKGGAMMGGFLGPITTASKATERALRQNKNGITLVQDGNNNTFELIGISGKDAFVQDQLMNQKKISADDIKDKVTLSKEQMDEYLDAYKNSQDLLPQLEQKARAQSDPDAPIKATINQYGEKLKFNSNVPLAEDQNPLISIASHKIEDKKFFLTGESGAIGDHVFTAYDFDALQEAGYDLTQVRPQLIKASDIRERMDIPYQEWLQQEVNQFKQAQVQGQQMVIKAQAPVQEGQEVTLKDKVFVVTAVDETGVTLNEMDKDGNVTGATLPVPPEDYEKVFGVPAVDPNVSDISDVSDPVETSETGESVGAENAIPPPIQLPVNKKGEIEYDQITEPEIYAQGLTQEFGEEAPAILDELIAEQTEALAKAKKGTNAIERARKVKAINAALTKLTHVKDIFNPPTAIAEGPSLEAPSASPVVEQPEPIEQATEQDLARPEEEEQVLVTSERNQTEANGSERKEAQDKYRVDKNYKPTKGAFYLRFTENPDDDVKHKYSRWYMDDQEYEAARDSGLIEGKDYFKDEDSGEYYKLHTGLSGHVLTAESLIDAIKEVEAKKWWFRNSQEDNWSIFESDDNIDVEQDTPEGNTFAPYRVVFERNFGKKTGESQPAPEPSPEVQKPSKTTEEPGKRQPLSAFKPGDIVRNVTGDVWEVVEIPADIEQRAILRDPNDGSTVEWSQKIVSWILQKKEESPEVHLTKANEQQGTDQETGQKADNTASQTEEDTTQRSDQAGTEGTGGEVEFAGEALDNTPRTRSLREFTKGDHVKNIKTSNEYVVISVPKTGDVSLKKLKGKEIQNFNGKSPQWIPIQREIKAKGAKRTVKFGPDSQKGKLLARMPQTFKEFVLQFFVRGGRVSHKDFLRYVGWKAGKKEGFIWAVKGAAVDPEGKTEQGKAFDSFWEDVPEEWGRRGGTEDTNEIADILKTYPSITQMMDELKRLQSTDESIPDRNMPSPEELGAAVSDADIEDDLSNHEDEIVGTYDDMWDNPDYQIIFDKYSTDKGLDVDKLLADINDNPGEISTLTPFGLNDKELNTLKKYLEDEQSRRKESQGTESIQGLDQDKGQSGEKDSSGSGQGDTVRTGSKEGEGSEVGSPGREFKYKMNARPFDIGTYPKDGFVKAEDDPRGGFQILTYNRKLTEKERNHWSFLPLTEVDELEGKQFEDQDGEYFVDLEWMPNYSGADVSMFDSKNQLVEKPYFMSTNDILKNIESGYWKEKRETEKPKETPKTVTKKKSAPLLTYIGIIDVLQDVRPTKDQRYKVDQHIVEYRDEENNEFRKSFFVRRGEDPNIPKTGTHEELNALRDQATEGNKLGQTEKKPADNITIKSPEEGHTDAEDDATAQKALGRGFKVWKTFFREKGTEKWRKAYILSAPFLTQTNALKSAKFQLLADAKGIPIGKENEALSNYEFKAEEVTKAADKPSFPDEVWQMTKEQYRNYQTYLWDNWIPEEVVKKSDTSGKWYANRPDGSPTTAWVTKTLAVKMLTEEKAGSMALVKAGNFDWEHKAYVEKAISDNKPVPKEVLAEYPDLKPKDDIDKINDILDKPAEPKKGPSYSPIQQKQIDKINKEYSELIAKKEAGIVQAEKDMREALLKADNRNGLFGDTNPVEKDEIIKRDEQGFTYDEATRAAVRKPFEKKMAELRKEIEELKLEQKGKIESVIKQQDLFADIPVEPAESKPIDKESLPKHEDFGQKIGGARKDMEITRKVRDTDSLPAWRRKYHYANANGTMTIGAPVDTSKPFIVQWAKDIDSWAGKRTVYRPVTTIDTRETKVFNSEEEAEAYIPIYEVWNQHFRVRKSGDNYVITKTSSTNKVVEYATFPTEEEANTYMYSTEGATSLLNHKREDFSIPALDKVERTGKDWRKGKDISTEEFMETFGFRGGEFGNWVKPEERRVMLNAAYDSFMDLAELLGVPPRSLSLSGELSIAFGARGVKGAAAHFEPDRAVINLTRMNGAGSLAHEWAHALDNYFGLQAAKKDYSRNDKGEVKAGKVMRTEAGLLAIQGMRKALSEKFDKIIEATQEKSVTRKMGIDEKQLAFDKFQKSVKREADDLIKKFTNGVRRYQYNRKTKQREDVVIKATPDQIKKAKDIVDKIIAGQGTKPTWDRIPGSKSRFGDYSYISPETLALDGLYKEVFGHSGLKRDGNGFYNLGYYGDRMYRAKETLDKALAGESETLTVPTDFLKESKWFDKSRATPYWSTKLEMFARAFEYFIETKLLDQNVRADYLQYDKAPVYDAVYGKNPYPAGEERAEINKLFQQFFDELKTKEEDGRTVMFRTSNDTYYSPIEKALKSVKQNKATVKQWKAMLLNNGAKQAELEWMGWDDAIEQGKPDRSLTKDELQKWIDQSKIDIHEVEMSDEKVMEKLDELNKQLNEAQEEYDRISESELGGRPYYSGSPLRWLYKAPSGNIVDVPEEHLAALEYYAEKKQAYEEYAESLDGPMRAGDGTKYGQYTLPGGKNYRELLLTMPSKSYALTELSDAEIIQREKDKGIRVEEKNGRLYVYDDSYQDPFIGSYGNEKELATSIRQEYEGNLARELRKEGEYHSGHWDEPNVLLHVRLNSRITPDGKNVLFIEEIQSDWAQQGKKKGFRGVFDEQRFEKWYKENKHSTDPTWEEYQELSDSEKKEYRDAFTDEIAQMGFVPNMPFKKTDQWAGLAVRRMIRYAIDEGYDAIAWTPGEVQSDRYNLRKHIDDLRWIHEKNGSYSIMGYQGEGKVFERSVPNEGLEEFVGKEIAGRMRENKSMTGQIKGEQLQVGGSGMTGFYDKILPTIANKIGKKFGAKVEPLIVVGDEESRLALRYQEVKKRLSEIESRKNELIRFIKENKGEEVSTKLADEYNSYNNEENDLRQEESDLERRVSPKVLYKQTYSNAVHSLPITNSMFDSFREGVPYFRIVDNPIADILDRVDQAEREFEVKDKIKALSKELNTPVVIVKSRTDLPQTIQADAKRKGLFGNESIYGVWNAPTGTMYIIMDDVMRQGPQRGLIEATKTILHEAVAHKGLPAMLGEEAYNEFLDELYDSIPADDISLIKYEYDTKDKRTIAAEYLAMMAEDNVNPSLFQRVVAMIRRLLRRVFSLDYSENDVYDMLRRSAENLRRQKRANTEFAGEYLEGAGETNILYRTNKPSDRFAGDWLEEQPEVGPNPELLKSAAQIYAERQAKGNISETVQGIREYIQDMNLPVRKFEEDVLKRGGQQDNNSKPYRDMNLSFGRQEKLYTDYFDKKMKPIFKAIAAIKKAGVKGEEILPYVIAKHAIERNPIMRGEALRAWVDGHQDATADEIDAKRAELKDLDYSGVKSFDGKNEYENPDALARDIVKAFESTVDKSLIDNFWNSVRTATSATLDTWEAGNQISAEQKKKYLEQYRFFVPLRGWRHGAAKELIYTRGEGFSKSLQKAEGRKSLADNPLAYILSVQFQAIAEQVDNEVKTSMYNLILKNLKNPEINELATIKKLYYVKIKHSDGTEEWEPTEQRPDQELFASGDAKTKIYREHERLRKFRHAKEHEVIVHKPGGDMIIVFKKNQLSTAHALNKQNYIYRTVFGNIYDARDVNKALALLGSMNNTLKALYTSWNVVFPFTNFMRDFQEASITQSIKQGTGLKVMANYKGAFPAVFRNLIGKPNLNSQMDRDLQDFYSLGGATGYTHTKTIEDIEKDVNREVDILVGKGTVLGSMKNGFRGTMGAVEAWNKVFEDATRFSVYLSSLAAGNSKQDAAMDAKEASVNFNRKGKGSKAWDSWFAFFNVALQSLQKNFKLAKDHTGKFTAVAGSFVMLGFLEALMNALTDDDDKDSAYYNINPWMRQNYLIIPNLPKILTTGEKGNKYLSIPLPQFWRGFKSIGAIAFDIATKKMTIGDGVMAALGNFGSGLLPVDIGGFYKSGEFSWAPVFPTVLKPIVEVAENKNYMGYAIKNEPFTREQKKDLANAGLGKTNVNPAAKYLTDMLFRWGGGKGKYKYYYDQEKGERRKVPGVLDINPSAIEHVFKGYTGGTGAGLSDLLTTVIQATSPEQDIDFKNVPFVNRFIRTVPEAKWNIISEYYNLRDDERANSKLEKEAVKDAETTGDWTTVTAMYGNEYLQRYQETFASFESELDDAMKMKDFNIVEGNRLSVEIMERAIAEIKELKREYGKK